MTFAKAAQLLLVLSVFLSVFALSLKARKLDALFMVHHPKLGIRALVAMYLVVPAVAVAMVMLFDISKPVQIAIVALSLSPMPPLLPKKQIKVGGGPDYVSGLFIGASLACLVIAPLWLTLIDTFVDRDLVVGPSMMFPVLLVTIALPLAAGRIVAAFMSDEKSQSVGGLIGKVALIMLVISALGLVVVLAPGVWAVIGTGEVIAIIAFVVVGLIAGYVLAGAPEYQPTLALAASNRHPGVAIAIATVSFPEERLAVAAIILYLIVNGIVGLPLLRRLMASDDTGTVPRN